MNIVQQPILEALGAPNTRYAIPVFQRVYSWNARQCDELWEDIVRAGRTHEPHFMGMLLFMADPDSRDGYAQVDVIDGQQRMTTMMLLISALKPEGVKLAPLVLSQMDRDTFEAIVAGDELPDEPAERLIANYQLFSQKAGEPGFDREAFIEGLGLLQVATAILGPNDSPQLVFESLNSKGMALTTADRVRNLLIASTSGEEQDRLYEELWMPLEDKAESAEPAATVTEVLHAWLAPRYRSVRILDESEVYGVFKTCLRDEYGGSLERALTEVNAYGERYLSDEDFRENAREKAQEWVAGKPEKLISEFKLFGD